MLQQNNHIRLVNPQRSKHNILLKTYFLLFVKQETARTFIFINFVGKQKDIFYLWVLKFYSLLNFSQSVLNCL